MWFQNKQNIVNKNQKQELQKGDKQEPRTEH